MTGADPRLAAHGDREAARMGDVPQSLPDIFAMTVEGVAVQLVRPADAPEWVVYAASEPLGTVRWTQHDAVPSWSIGTRSGRHGTLSDALTTLMHPRSARDEEM
ncbi:hypothetical protein BJP40_00165 [Streptomyces sp. CC53]|uniref:hypothetical protein n=1 Tax=Streptomyces sp. CC53 TaxID=1906740 RepID=UPI0008DDF4EF|nr:hypothetical protein [Streptomyces sp. CC53]OII64317.1 hypothetical protein BJP40_00165 [Streptomyces sp. CC53]